MEKIVTKNTIANFVKLRCQTEYIEIILVKGSEKDILWQELEDKKILILINYYINN